MRESNPPIKAKLLQLDSLARAFAALPSTSFLQDWSGARISRLLSDLGTEIRSWTAAGGDEKPASAEAAAAPSRMVVAALWDTFEAARRLLRFGAEGTRGQTAERDLQSSIDQVRRVASMPAREGTALQAALSRPGPWTVEDLVKETIRHGRPHMVTFRVQGAANEPETTEDLQCLVLKRSEVYLLAESIESRASEAMIGRIPALGRFSLEQSVCSIGPDFRIEGIVLALFAKTSGRRFAVLEDRQGALHVCDEDSLADADSSAPAPEHQRHGLALDADENTGRDESARGPSAA